MTGALADLFINPSPNAFGGRSAPREKSRYSVVGVPFDSTSSARPGSRYAPREVRHASANIEFYSFRSGVDVDRIPICDEGDVAVVHGDAEATLSRVREVASKLYGEGKIAVFIGGEHTISIASCTPLPKVACLAYLDAHFDLRHDYLGYKLSHACTLRRILEQRRPEEVVVVGVRACEREELEHAVKEGVEYITPQRLRVLGLREVARRLSKKFEPCDSVYITVDMDVFDPAYAPGVSTPEPDGLEPWMVLDLLAYVVDERLRGLDVVEVSPPYDPAGVTSLLAAKIIVEVIAAHYKSVEGSKA